MFEYARLSETLRWKLPRPSGFLAGVDGKLQTIAKDAVTPREESTSNLLCKCDYWIQKGRCRTIVHARVNMHWLPEDVFIVRVFRRNWSLRSFDHFSVLGRFQ